MNKEPNGDSFPSGKFERRMDQINDFLQSMVAAMQEYHRLNTIQHEQIMTEIHTDHAHFMEEMRELRDLQKEQRIDIMALFQLSKETRQRLDKAESPPQEPTA
jgi:replicative DNA helicase